MKSGAYAPFIGDKTPVLSVSGEIRSWVVEGQAICTWTAGDLSGSQNHGLVQSPEFRRLLTISKKGVEREDRGVVAGQPVAPAYVHCMHDFERDTGHEGFFRSNREQELVYQSYDFCFKGLCCLLCPVEQVYKKFPDHRTDQSGTGVDLNSDDPFSSINSMSDEMLRDFLC